MNETLATVLAGLVTAVVIAVGAWVGGRILGAVARWLARRSPGDYASNVVEAWRPLYGWLVAAFGYSFAAAWLDFLGEAAREVFDNLGFLLVVLTLAEGSRRLVAVSLDEYVEQRKDQIDMNMARQLVPLGRRMATIVIYVIAIVAVAGQLGIDLIAAGAALGLTGFAIALALKDTISNLFSGLVIMVSRPFAIGDRVEVPALETWGDVTDIGIRSTTVRMRDNRLVIVPNSSIVDNAIVNYSRPDPSYRLELDIDLENDVDMRLAHEAIRAGVREVEGVMPDKPVDVWITGFNQSDLRARVRWWIPDYSTWRASTDAVAQAIVTATDEAGIYLPEPKLLLGGRLAMRRDTTDE